MRNEPTPCLPETTPFEPWFELYFGASFCPDCFEATVPRIEAEPVLERGDAWAVAARAYASLGRPGEAMRAWDRAQSFGGAEVDSLAIWLSADGLRRAEARAEAATDAGLRADAWCDVAALRLNVRDLGPARRAIGQALAACPDHGESHHWLRFFALPDAGKAVQRVQNKPSRRGASLAIADAISLLPLRSNGWVSPERLHRRALLDPPVEVAPGSALAALRAAGVPDTYLATEADWARVPDRHPLVTAELELDTLCALVGEHRPALMLARSVWDAARGSGDALRVDDIAQLLCALGTQDESLAAVAKEAAGWLADTNPNSKSLFAAYSGWFAAVLGENGAAAVAAERLSRGVEDDVSWRLLLGAVYRAGSAELGREELDRALRHPTRRALALSLRRSNAAPEAPVIAISPRISGRDLAATRPVGLA